MGILLHQVGFSGNHILVVALTPYKFSDSVAMFQSWVPGFDPRHPVGLTVPVWISLRLLPLEYLEFARTISGQIGRVLEEHEKVTVTQDPRFCVELEVDKGWIASLELPNLLGRRVEVIIHYDDSMRCNICFGTSHRGVDCPTLGVRDSSVQDPAPPRRPREYRSRRQPRRPMLRPPISPQVRAELEERGFTVVERRKNKPVHQATYWHPRRGGHRTPSGASDRDIDMLDGTSDVSHSHPPLPSGPRNPTPPPFPRPASPQIPESIQKELEAMEIEFTEIANADPSILREDYGVQAAQDSSIIMVGPVSKPGPDPPIMIPETPPHSLQPQPVLTLAIRPLTPPSGRFFFNPISKTEQSEPQDDFQDAQGFQLSPTFSDPDPGQTTPPLTDQPWYFINSPNQS